MHWTEPATAEDSHILDSRTLAELLKTMASTIPMDKGGNTFGLIYE